MKATRKTRLGAIAVAVLLLCPFAFVCTKKGRDNPLDPQSPHYNGDTTYTWEKTYGGIESDWGGLVAPTSDGGYVVAGVTYSFGAGDNDVYLIKTNALGDKVWTRTYGGTHMDWGYSVAPTSDGGYIVAGETYSFGAGEYDVYLVKTNALGDKVWTRTYGGADWDAGLSVAPTSDGGYIVAGATYSFGAGEYDVYLIKTDVSGNTVWTRTFGGTGEDYGFSVVLTSDGGYIVAGATYSFGAGEYDVYLVKTDASGNTVWTRTFGGTSYDLGYSVAPTSDGGYIVAGETNSYGAGNTDVYLIKVDASGDIAWSKTYGGSSEEGGNSVAQTGDGGYIVAGYTISFGAGATDVYLIKTNASGGTLWTRTYGGTGNDYGYSVAPTSDGGYIVAGETNSFGAGGYDVYLIKVDANGDL